MCTTIFWFGDDVNLFSTYLSKKGKNRKYPGWHVASHLQDWGVQSHPPLMFLKNCIGFLLPYFKDMWLGEMISVNFSVSHDCHPILGGYRLCALHGLSLALYDPVWEKRLEGGKRAGFCMVPDSGYVYLTPFENISDPLSSAPIILSCTTALVNTIFRNVA